MASPPAGEAAAGRWGRLDTDDAGPPRGAVSGLWRSEEMELVSLSIDRDMLETAVRRMGEVACVEFRALTDPAGGQAAAGRKRGEYTQQVRLCESIERRLRYFDEIIARFPGAARRGRESPTGQTRHPSPGGGSRDGLLGQAGGGRDPDIRLDAPLGVPAFGSSAEWAESPDALDALDDKLQHEERYLRDDGSGLVSTLEQGVDRYCGDLEHLSCLRALGDPGSGLNPGAELGVRSFDEMEEIEEHHRGFGGRPSAVTARLDIFRGELVGTIPVARLELFRRLAARSTKGNAIVVAAPIDVARAYDECGGGTAGLLDELGERERVEEQRAAFKIVYTAEAAQWRLHKLCLSCGARVFRATPIVAGAAIGVSAQDAADRRRDALHRLGALAIPDGSRGARDAAEELHGRVLRDVSLLRSTLASIRDEIKYCKRHQLQRRRFVLKEKAMYNVLNAMVVRGDRVESSCWVPARQVSEVRRLCEGMRDAAGRAPILRTMRMEDARDAAGNPETPPTHFATNVITATFQGIVDAYGVPRYLEVNPAVWTIITFPWLFGVMYGDIGHGLLITASAALLCIYERELSRMRLNEIADMIFGARYLLVMMGLFAVYLGFLYNDCFGIMLEYSPSRYRWPEGWEGFNHNETPGPSCFKGSGGMVPLSCGACPIDAFRKHTFKNTSYCGCPVPPAGVRGEYPCASPPGFPEDRGYAMMSPKDGPTPFGIDVAWSEADNKLEFYNSFKMKNAVILGVIQMLGGLVLSLFNHLFRNDRSRIMFQFVPEVAFLVCTFGYMCVMIIIKWTTEWQNTYIAPNVLESMTNFFLSPGSYPVFSQAACSGPNKECTGYSLLYPGQQGIQTVLIIIAFAVLPLLLFPIPILEGQKKKRIEARGEDSGIDMQEVWIKQVIHTIEYVLGCVSNTASYLRLWALSLAHAELSEVFWQFAFMLTLRQADGGIFGGVVMYIGFGIWFSATLGVLVVMEALGAFLHTLRLHWVEFQNKFYVGDGRKFSPLDFDAILADAGVRDDPEQTEVVLTPAGRYGQPGIDL